MIRSEMTNETSIWCGDFRQTDEFAVNQEKTFNEFSSHQGLPINTYHEPYRLSYLMWMLLTLAFWLLMLMPSACHQWHSLHYSSSRPTRSPPSTIGNCTSEGKGKNFAVRIWRVCCRRKSFYLQLHVTIPEMVLLHSKSQSQNGLFQSFTSGFQRFILFDILRTSMYSIDEPCQFHCRFRSTWCAVNINSIVDLIACTTARDSGIRFG